MHPADAEPSDLNSCAVIHSPDPFTHRLHLGHLGHLGHVGRVAGRWRDGAAAPAVPSQAMTLTVHGQLMEGD